MMRSHTSTSDTIAAVSSPPGRSLRGLLRLSGRDTQTVLSHIVDSPHNLPPRTLQRVRLLDPPMPALLAFFPGPHSYTGDDVAELQLPGHPALLDRVLHAMLDAGARLAEPGEFTFRGYLAGRFDLTQAEGIAATIAAVSDSQLAAATLLREGKLAGVTRDMVDQLATVLALVEAGIDFVDQEDVVPIAPADLHAELTRIVQRLHDLLQRSRSWGALEALPRVVLVGPPSVGKSTLFNALLGRERAVIDALPGTTRDVLAEPIILHDAHGRPVEVMLVDIAGLDRAEALLDEQVQAAAHRAIAQADLLLYLTDHRENPSPPQSPAPPGAGHAPALHVHTKADTSTAAHPPNALPVSAHTGEGLDALRAAIARHIAERGVSVAADMLALQPRHEHALKAADEQLAAALDWLTPQRDAPALDDVELIAAHLRSTLDALAGLGGQMTPDDVIGRVFATFCVGK